MGKKRKRRRRKPAGARPARPASPADDGAAQEAPERDTPALVDDRAGDVPPQMGSAPEPAPAPARRGLFGGGMGVPSPYPSLGDSLAAGVGPVAASPLILAATFLVVLVLWLLFYAPRGIGSASLLSVMSALPPLSLLSDGLVLLQDPSGAVRPFLSVLGILAVRALGLVVVAGLVVTTLREGRPNLRRIRDRFLTWSWRLFAVLSAQLGLMLGAFMLLQGFLGPQFAVLFTWIMGLYFLVFAPVVLVAEDVATAEVLRRSVRAARLPGMRHLTLVVAYFAFVFWVSTATLDPAVTPATPSFLTWLIVLGSAFVHLSVLAVVAYRWLAVREEVPTGPAERRRR